MINQPHQGRMPEASQPVQSPVAFTETAEFKSAVAKAAAEAAGKAVAEALAGLAPHGSKSSDSEAGAVDVIRQVASAIAEMNDQGTSRKRVAPEILAKRAGARDRMFAVLKETNETAAAQKHAGVLNPPRPEYRIIVKTYLNEQFIEPFQAGADKMPVPTEIIWSGVPNECMRPINDLAKPIFAAFIESIGGSTAVVETADNRAYSVTAGGLVVKAPIHKRQVSQAMPDVVQNDYFAEDLGIKTPNDPRQEFVHVLGTVAAPARQNFAGGQTNVRVA